MIVGTYLKMGNIILYGLASRPPTGGKLENLMQKTIMSPEYIYSFIKNVLRV